MKRNLMLTVATIGMMGAFLNSATDVFAETLQEALIAAYSNNPTLEAQRAALRATDEGVSQAVSGWRPTITAGGSISHQDSSQTSSFGGASTTNDSTLTPRSGQVTLTQPLFHGFQTANNTKEAKSLVKAGREQLKDTEQTVLLNAVKAYMNVKRDEAVLELRRNNVQVLQRQLEASQDRFRVGEITRTDVAQSRARLSRAISDRISAEGTLQVSRANYLKIVGNMPGSLDIPPPLPPLPASEEAAVNLALAQNPVLQAARYGERASYYSIKSQEGGLLPQINLQAQYSRAYDTSTFVSNQEQKSISAQLTMPLYQSGFQSSKIRQAKQINQQRRLQILEAERQVREAVKNAWEVLRAARGRIVSTRDQVKANEIALEGVNQEATVGSRTTLDVLNAEQELLDSRVNLVQAERDQYVSAYQLLNSIGSLTADALALPVDRRYNPRDHYQDVRGQFYGWGTDDRSGWESNGGPAPNKATNPVDWDAKMSEIEKNGMSGGTLALPDSNASGGGDGSMWDTIDDTKQQ